MLISASTNPPKVEDLSNYILQLEKLDIDYIHCDVMDGNFVKSTTFDYNTIKQIKKITNRPLDVHLMISQPQKVYKKYIRAGANILTVHYESFSSGEEVLKILKKIKRQNTFVGLSFKPTTNVDEILPFLCFIDVLLVMSVEPGKSGQEFIENTYDKIKQIQNFIREYKINCIIEVDGGVNDSNIHSLKSLGVGMVVVGNYLFSSKDKKSAILKLK